MIDAYATQPHYADHIMPIWRGLPDRLRGEFGAPRWSWWGKPFSDRRSTNPIIVAGMTDKDRWAGERRPIIYVEHGAGQSYDGDERAVGNGSFSGGRGFDSVVLFICPSYRVAMRWQARYPDADVAVVGCPKLDSLRDLDTSMASTPLVAVTFRWDGPLSVPETMSALPHYVKGLRPLGRALGLAGAALVGHAHPRSLRLRVGTWAAVGAPLWADGGEVLCKADVLVGDNTSLLYEFASLGKPVVVMNAPWYRRDVEHGLRFWNALPGPTVDGPDELYDAIMRVIEEPEADSALRSAAVLHAYSYVDDQAAGRAVRAILDRFDA